MTTRSLPPLPWRTMKLKAAEVEVVNAKLTALLAAHARAVEQARHQAVAVVGARHGVEEETDFLGRQDEGQAFGPARAAGVDARQFDAEHLLIKEQQGEQGLVLGAGGDMAVDGQVGEEPLDLRRAHGAGVAHAVEADELLDPVGVGVRGAGRVMAKDAGAAQAVEQARRLGQGQIADVDAEDMLVEEGESGVGFVQTGQRVFFGVGDVVEESPDVVEREVAGVAFMPRAA